MDRLNKYILIVLFSLLITGISCETTNSTEDSVEEEVENESVTITVGIFTESNGTYTSTGNEFIFDSEEECQSWSRTSQADNHSNESHLHYNAAANVNYVSSSTTFSWTEFGPELDQSSIDATCSTGANGANKTVNDTDYFKDKDIYLRITKVE